MPAPIRDDLGYGEESRAIAEKLVEQHFDDPPPNAAEVVANGATLLAKLCSDAGEVDRAIELLDRAIARYGQPDAPDHAGTRAWAIEDALGLDARFAYEEDAMERPASRLAVARGGG